MIGSICSVNTSELSDRLITKSRLKSSFDEGLSIFFLLSLFCVCVCLECDVISGMLQCQECEAEVSPVKV